jgi:hypothetical protein
MSLPILISYGIVAPTRSSNQICTSEDMAELIEASTAKPGPRGPIGLSVFATAIAFVVWFARLWGRSEQAEAARHSTTNHGPDSN